MFDVHDIVEAIEQCHGWATEHFVAFDRNGDRIAEGRGRKYRCAMPDDARGGAFVHTHPILGSLSLPDCHTAASFDLRHMIAVDPVWVHWMMAPTDGWNPRRVNQAFAAQGEDEATFDPRLFAHMTGARLFRFPFVAIGTTSFVVTPGGDVSESPTRDARLRGVEEV